MGKKAKIKQKKLLMFLPVLVLLLSAWVFHALGGGSGKDETLLPASGINRSLPDANFKQAVPVDKLGFYELRDRDSAKVRRLSGEALASGLGFTDRGKAQTIAIEKKLQLLTQEISKPDPGSTGSVVGGIAGYTVRPAVENAGLNTDVDRLESLMKTMQAKKEEDPEITQLNGMLDRILSIQNPDLVPASAGRVPVVAAVIDSQFRAVPAVIVDKQKVTQGASVRLRLQDSLLTVTGVVIPKGHELYAVTRLANHRLLLDIKNIRLGTSIIPVNLSVYSLDGMPGVDAPAAELAVAVGSGTNDALQSMQFLSMDQSLGVQAAGAGIDAAKSLLGKKVRKIKVQLKAGQQVLLRNNQVKLK